VEGRDCLDVALFQCGGLGQPRAVRLLLARGPSPALSYRSCGRKPVAGCVDRRWQAAAGIGGPQLLGAHAGGLGRGLYWAAPRTDLLGWFAARKRVLKAGFLPQMV